MNKDNLGMWSLFGAIGIGLAAAIAAYLVSDVPLIWQIGSGLAGALLIAHFVLSRKTYVNLFSKRTTQMGLRTVVNAVLVIAILVFINMIVNRYDVKKDFTKNKLHSLSDQSVKILGALKEPVALKAFINPQQMGEFENIFEKYTYHSRQLKKEYIDMDRDPLVVQKYNIKAAGTLIVEAGDRTVRVENLSGPDDPKLEEKITNAIIQATKGGKKKLYYVSGHGERLLSDTGREGYSQMKEELEGGRYEVQELALIEKGTVPTDAELVIVAGPKSDFMEQELKSLETYIRGGGKVLFMVEPTSSSTLKPFLAKFGAEWTPKKVILETNSLQQLAGGNPLTPIVTNYDHSSEITKEAKQLSLFPIAAPIERTATAPTGMTVIPLFSSSAKSLEVDLKGDKVNVNQAKDRKGPFTMALSVSGKVEAAKPTENKGAEPGKEEKQKEFRLVVVGDSDFASNSARRFGINADLFQNMLSWIAQEEDLISIRPRPSDESEFEITEQRSRVINLASIVFAPFLMFLSGVGVWITRRRK